MPDRALLTLRFSDAQSVGRVAALLSSLDNLYFTDAVLSSFVDQRKPGELKIQRLHIGSPGWLEVIGSLNPINFIYDMTKLILDYFTSLEFQRLSYREKELQIEKAKIEILDAKAEFLRKWGFSEELIQEEIARALLDEKVSKFTYALGEVKIESVDYEELPD
jgi:hypothetical protein